MSAEMYSEVFTLFRLNESGIYICLICEQNIFADLSLEPHALEEHLLAVHDLTFQQQDEILEDPEVSDLRGNDIGVLGEEDDLDDPDYSILTSSNKRKHFKSPDIQMSETNSAIMELFEHIEGSKYQCKKCFKVLRHAKGNNLQTHVLQKHAKLYNQILGQNKHGFLTENGEVGTAVDNSTVLAWMGHIKQRRRTYDQYIKSIQKQLDEKYDLYKQIGKDIDYLNEELDQYRITWLKEQKRIETITNFILSNKNDDIQSIEKPISIMDDNNGKINFVQVHTSKSEENDEELDDIISDVATNEDVLEPASKKIKTLDNAKPIFKICFAERKP